MVEVSICDVFNVSIAILNNFLFSSFFFLLLTVKLFLCHLILFLFL